MKQRRNHSRPSVPQRNVWQVLSEFQASLVELREILGPILDRPELFAPFAQPVEAAPVIRGARPVVERTRRPAVRIAPAKKVVDTAPSPAPPVESVEAPVEEVVAVEATFLAETHDEVPRNAIPSTAKGQSGLLQVLTRRLPRGLRNEVLVIRHRQGMAAAIRRAEEVLWAEKLLKQAAQRSTPTPVSSVTAVVEKPKSFDDLLAHVVN